MIRKTGYLLVVLLILGMALGVAAQDDGDVYTFDSGAQFILPDGLSVIARNGLPEIQLGESTVLEVIDPGFLSQTFGISEENSLEDVLDTILSALGYEEPRSEEATDRFELEDGREGVSYSFVYSDGADQAVVVLRMSNGQIGALNLRTLVALTDEAVNVYLTVLNSFDVPAETAASLADGLEQELTYESGTRFRYPDHFFIEGADSPIASIGIENEIAITMVDPTLVGLPAGEPMESVIDFAVANVSVTTDDFEPLDIGGREAVFGTAPDGQIYRTLVLVRFSDDTVGIMDISTLAEPTEEQVETIRRIAASFDSPDSESGASREDMERASELVDEAMAAYEDGDDQRAVDLFTQAIAIDPYWGIPFFFRASSYEALGQLDNAIADYRQALELAPGEDQIREDIADVYALAGDVEAAVAELTLYIETVGESNVSADTLTALAVYQEVADGGYNEDYYFRRANRLRQIGLFEEALASNQIALDNNPENPQLYLQRGEIYFTMEDFSGAVDVLTDGLEVELLPTLFYYRGFAYERFPDRDFDATVGMVHNYQCALLLAEDDTFEQGQIDGAERIISRTFISGDDYEPIEDADDCKP